MADPESEQNGVGILSDDKRPQTMRRHVTHADDKNVFIGEVEPTPSRGSGESKESDEWKWDFKGVLLPGVASRIFRPLSLTGSGIDQLDRVFDGTVDPESGQPNFSENPVGDLQKLEFSIKPGSVFRSTSELKDAYALALGDTTKTLIDSSSDPLADTVSGQKLHQLAWADGSGVGKRLLSAFEATLGYTERSPFSGPTLLDEEIRGEDDEEFVYSVTLDLDRFVVFPSEVLEAYEALQQHTKVDSRNEAGLDFFSNKDCERKNPIECLRDTSGIGVRGRWLAGLLPKLSFKTVDQFDFILAAGQPFPLNEDSLETFTVTWDLGSALDSAKHRRAAIKALGIHKALAARDDRRKHNLQPVIKVDNRNIRIPSGFPVPIQLQAGYESELARKPAEIEWNLMSVRLAARSWRSYLIQELRSHGGLASW